MLSNMREWFAVVVYLYAASVMIVSPNRVLDAFRVVMKAAGTFSMELKGMPFLNRPDSDPLPETPGLRLAVRLAGVVLTIPALAAVVSVALR